MLLARLAESRRPHLGHSVHLCTHPIPHPLGSKGLGQATQSLEYSVSGVSPMSDSALSFVVVNVMSLSGCTPADPTPVQSLSDNLVPSYTPFLGPMTLVTWPTWLWVLSLKWPWPSVSGETPPAISVQTDHSLPWTVVFLARPWPRLGLDTNDQILHVWALVLFVLNLLVGIINTTEPTSK